MADEIVVEFDESVQSLDALNAAAYRLLDVANCAIERRDGNFVCRLTPKNSGDAGDQIRMRFLDCVTDESLRERLAVKTEPVRNLILSLAFGALASKRDENAG
jgi:His-Xaa-Ser system protein HxsD